MRHVFTFTFTSFYYRLVSRKPCCYATCLLNITHACYVAWISQPAHTSALPVGNINLHQRNWRYGISKTAPSLQAQPLLPKGIDPVYEPHLTVEDDTLSNIAAWTKFRPTSIHLENILPVFLLYFNVPKKYILLDLGPAGRTRQSAQIATEGTRTRTYACVHNSPNKIKIKENGTITRTTNASKISIHLPGQFPPRGHRQPSCSYPPYSLRHPHPPASTSPASPLSP